MNSKKIFIKKLQMRKLEKEKNKEKKTQEKLNNDNKIFPVTFSNIPKNHILFKNMVWKNSTYTTALAL